MKAKAEQYGMAFVELREIEIPASVIELVPESLARENIVMPLAQENGTIKVIMHDPMDFETIDKLRFVLNREIEVVALAPKEAIVEAINRYYGSSTAETESVDSMLQEFTDTAIDFAEDGPARTRAAETQHPGGRRRPGHQAGAPDHPGSGQHAGLRHPHRAVRRPRPDPLPDRRRPAWSATRPPGGCSALDRQPPQDHGLDRHRRETPAAGRPDQDHVAGKDIDLRVSILPTNHGQSVVMRILDRDNIKVGLRDLGFGEEDWKRFSEPHQAAQRHLAGDRPDRLGQDHHPLRRA